MKLAELAKEYGLLIDEEGNYYQINKHGEREEPFASLTVIAEIIGINYKTLCKRIEKNNLRTIPQKTWNGHLCNAYNLNRVKRLCAELLNAQNIIKDQGIVLIAERQFASIPRLAKILGISSSSIRRRIQENKLQAVSAKNSNGKMIEVYDVEMVRTLCSYLLISLPVINAQDDTVIDGRQFASIPRLAKMFGISTRAIASRILRNKVQSALGKKLGKITEIYDVETVKHLCSDLLDDLPELNVHGILTINAGQFTTISQLSKMLGIANHTLMRRVAKGKLQPVLGRRKGQLIEVYEIKAVKLLCLDLIADYPLADAQSILTINGVQFASRDRISRILKISNHKVRKVVQQKQLKPTLGMSRNGHVLKLYDIEKIRLLCPSSLKRKKKQNSR